MGLQQPARQAVEAYADGLRPEDLLQLGLVDQNAQPGIELLAQAGKLGEDAETDLQGADDWAVRLVAGPQRGDGAVADAVPANVQPGGHLPLMQRRIE